MELDGGAHDIAAICGVLLAGWHLVTLRDRRTDPAVVAQLDPAAVVAGSTVRRRPSNRRCAALLRDLAQRSEPHVFVSSSGSTGRPTLAGFSLRRVCERASVESSAIGTDDVVALSGSHGSLAGIVLALAALDRGARIAFVGTGSSPAAVVARDLEVLGATRWSCSATLLAAMLVRWMADGAPRGLRRIDVRGEELTPALAQAVLELQPGVELWHTYGLTESGQGCSWRVLAEDLPRRSFVPIGCSYLDPHVTVQAGQIVIADGRPPEMLGTARGHIGRRRRQPELATGDAGSMYPDGIIEYRGRIGERLAATSGTITGREAARRVMRAFPLTHAIGIADAGVVGVGGDRSLDASIDAAACKWGFPVVRLQDPPRLSSGKLDRAVVEKLLRQGAFAHRIREKAA